MLRPDFAARCLGWFSFSRYDSERVHLPLSVVVQLRRFTVHYSIIIAIVQTVCATTVIAVLVWKTLEAWDDKTGLAYALLTVIMVTVFLNWWQAC